MSAHIGEPDGGDAGVEAGGKTGLTAVTVGIFFLIAIFFSPLASLVPSYATSGALIYVAILMHTESSGAWKMEEQQEGGWWRRVGGGGAGEQQWMKLGEGGGAHPCR